MEGKKKPSIKQQWDAGLRRMQSLTRKSQSLPELSSTQQARASRRARAEAAEGTIQNMHCVKASVVLGCGLYTGRNTYAVID